MAFIAVKTLSGFNYVRADQVVAVQTSPTGGAVLVLVTGVLIQSAESPKEIALRLEAAESAAALMPKIEV